MRWSLCDMCFFPPHCMCICLWSRPYRRRCMWRRGATLSSVRSCAKQRRHYLLVIGLARILMCMCVRRWVEIKINCGSAVCFACLLVRGFRPCDRSRAMRRTIWASCFLYIYIRTACFSYTTECIIILCIHIRVYIPICWVCECLIVVVVVVVLWLRALYLLYCHCFCAPVFHWHAKTHNFGLKNNRKTAAWLCVRILLAQWRQNKLRTKMCFGQRITTIVVWDLIFPLPRLWAEKLL